MATKDQQLSVARQLLAELTDEIEQLVSVSEAELATVINAKLTRLNALRAAAGQPAQHPATGQVVRYVDDRADADAIRAAVEQSHLAKDQADAHARRLAHERATAVGQAAKMAGLGGLTEGPTLTLVDLELAVTSGKICPTESRRAGKPVYVRDRRLSENYADVVGLVEAVARGNKKQPQSEALRIALDLGYLVPVDEGKGFALSRP